MSEIAFKAKFTRHALFRMAGDAVVVAGLLENGHYAATSPVLRIEPCARAVMTQSGGFYGLGLIDRAVGYAALAAVRGHAYAAGAQPYSKPKGDLPVVSRLASWARQERGEQVRVIGPDEQGAQQAFDVLEIDPGGRWARIEGGVVMLGTHQLRAARPLARLAERATVLRRDQETFPYRTLNGFDGLVDLVMEKVRLAGAPALNPQAYDHDIAEALYKAFRNHAGRETSDRMDSLLNDLVEAGLAPHLEKIHGFVSFAASKHWIRYIRRGDIALDADRASKFYITLPEGDRFSMLKQHLPALFAAFETVPEAGEIQIKFPGTYDRLAADTDTIVIHFGNPAAAPAILRAVEASGMPRQDRRLQGRLDFGMDQDGLSESQVVTRAVSRMLITAPTFHLLEAAAEKGREPVAAVIERAISQVMRERADFLEQDYGVPAVQAPVAGRRDLEGPRLAMG